MEQIFLNIPTVLLFDDVLGGAPDGVAINFIIDLWGLKIYVSWTAEYKRK
ncbi:hypothetical protein C2G38_2198807 [Gigaspora rosea]|uniref:Uncharacterized protein n=1 Tax=Gigaspora rosea TaxID=44941 RepID=A0A397USB6_9GLOM|nr:hypothetical protein C2G38_2198807 [Gigaspora rosea]